MFRNYTGDILNFGLAKEQYAALHPSKADRVKFVIVGDDVAVGRSQGKIVGRRYVFVIHMKNLGPYKTLIQRTCRDRSRVQNCGRPCQEWCQSE